MTWIRLGGLLWKYGPTLARMYWRTTGALGKLKWPVRIATGYYALSKARPIGRFAYRLATEEYGGFSGP